MPNEEELHWFCFSYIGNALECGGLGNGCVYSSYRSKNITLGMIKDNKGGAGLRDDATLISVSYLGYMTRKEFAAE